MFASAHVCAPRKSRRSAWPRDRAHDARHHRIARRARTAGTRTTVNVDALPDHLYVPDVALRLRCSACGSKRIVTRPNWREPPVRRVYRVARRSVFSADEATQAFLARVRKVLCDDARFPALPKGKKLPRKLRDTAWGFRRTLPRHGDVLAIDPDRFERMIKSKAAANAVLDQLVQRRIAVTDGAGKRRVQIKVQGFARKDRPRWICLHEAALSG